MLSLKFPKSFTLVPISIINIFNNIIKFEQSMEHRISYLVNILKTTHLIIKQGEDRYLMTSNLLNITFYLKPTKEKKRESRTEAERKVEL